MSTFNYNEILSASTKLSDFLNIPGYVPVISSWSACFRASLSTVQIISGIALIILGSVNLDPKMIDFSAKILLQGFYNNLRSIIEAFPFLNLLCLGFDKYTENLNNKFSVLSFIA